MQKKKWAMNGITFIESSAFSLILREYVVLGGKKHINTFQLCHCIIKHSSR